MGSRQGSAERSAPASGHPAVVRRADPAPRHRGPGTLPPEIAFLAAQGVAPGILLKAADRAHAAGVSPDAALLGEGFPEDTFYRLLARHLGVPYLDEALPLALLPGRGPAADALGIAPLQANGRHLDFVLAPRGRRLSLLLGIVRSAPRPARFAICSPRCLAALVRRRDRPALLRQSSQGLADWDETLSARAGLTRRQKWVSAGVGAAILLGIMLAPQVTEATLLLAAFVLFFCSVVLQLAATSASVASAPVPEPRIPDHELPVYTILLPLFREARVLPRLVAALDALDYPPSKLDIKVMVEANDPATIAALEAINLPSRYDVIVAPPGSPQTKPRALNIALLYARGDFLVVYDAEDRPDPGQLRAAVGKFQRGPGQVACLQARLAVDHIDETWLTRLFGLEYEALFGVIKPGLAVLRLPIPLGGTSNHFRVPVLHRVGAWDAWNVTEDIDLGFRLARFGYKVETLASTTFEEAPLTVRQWLPQRSRWLKGWMITLAVHTRQPLRLVRELGPIGAGAVALALFGTVLSCLLGPVFVAMLSVQAVEGWLLAPATPGRALLNAAECFLLIFGPISVVWPVALGLRRRGRLDLIAWMALLPLYMLMISLAAWRALYEAIRAPHAWNKTEHGLAQQRASTE